MYKVLIINCYIYIKFQCACKGNTFQIILKEKVYVLQHISTYKDSEVGIYYTIIRMKIILIRKDFIFMRMNIPVIPGVILKSFST